MICTFTTACPRNSRSNSSSRVTGGMGSEGDDRSSLSRESIFSEGASAGNSCSSSGLAGSSSASNSAVSSRESSFDEFRSDSCDFCDDEEDDEVFQSCKSKLPLGDSDRQHPQRDDLGVVSTLDGRQQAIAAAPHDNNDDLLFKALQCRWLVLRDQLQLESEEAREALFENAYLMLDQDLQPISPATDIPDSVRIFEEHKQLAKEYLQAQMEIEDLLQTKHDLEKQLSEQKTNGPRMSNQDQMKEWRELQSENESLVQFHKQLKRQLELIKGRGRSQHRAPSPEPETEPGWVIVPRRES